MAKGQTRTVQERLNAIVTKRSERRARFDEADAIDAEKEYELREKLVRQEVAAEVAGDIDRKVAERLAQQEGSQDFASDEPREISI